MSKPLDDYIKRAYENAKSKGFHLDDDEMRNKFKFRSTDYEHFCRLAMIKDLALIVTEISEAIEAIRENRFTDYHKINFKETFEEEIADVFIRLFDFCGNYGIDIETFINFKMDYNESREWKHGKTL